MTSKRSRDGYSDSTINGGLQTFPIASADVLMNRRIVKSLPSRRYEFIRHIKGLNTSFIEWMKDKIVQPDEMNRVNGCKDYIDYCQELQSRYLKSFGEVLTFGSGDCGQLAHGNEEDNDLMVKYPRIVYSLRDKKVCGIACGGLHNAVFTESGQVYTWGCNDDASLGRLGDETIPTLVDELINHTVIAVACGDGQTLALTTDGEVFGWGCYKDKEGNKWFNPDPSVSILYNDIRKQQILPIRIAGLSNIAELACGSSFNLARTDDGELYSWGISECGEIARDTIVLKDGRKMVESKFLQQVLDEHLTPGHMFIHPMASSGGNLTPETACQRRSNLSYLSNVKAIGCGAYHSLVVAVGGQLYSSGLNNYAQLGLGHIVDQKYLCEVACVNKALNSLPTDPTRSIKSAKGGMHHSLALTNDGIMLAWGRSDYCQLGNSAEDNIVSEAGGYSADAVIPQMPKGIVVKEIACGGNHNLALVQTTTSESTTTAVYTWGYGDMLALGHGRDKDEPIPKKLEFSKAKIANILVTQVAGGGQHSALIGQVIST